MPVLTWDKVGDRKYETGLDRGVLYLANGSAVPWNGLTSIIEGFNKESSPVYYDGMKINDLITLGDFSATMKAMTYPDEFIEIEGLGNLGNGLFAGDQTPQSFCLCYRTRIGNDVKGSELGYKIHLLYNVTAIPSDKTYASITESPQFTEFEWKITAVPEEIPGLRPTAHLIINSIDLDPILLNEVEAILYGNSNAVAALIPMITLIKHISEWRVIKIVDNGDGTWTAIYSQDKFLNFLSQDLFELNTANVTYVDSTLYVLTDTV